MGQRVRIRKGRSLKPAFMKNKELTPKQLIAVPCRTCGAAIGEPCELHSGALRSERRTGTGSLPQPMQ